jgi:trans-aconitate 2-methyltransferase
MIAKASQNYPDWHWIHRDARDLPSQQTYDLVFSNAALQWIPDHEVVIPHLFRMVRETGALAAQIPLFEGMPVRKAIAIVADRSPWRALMSGITPLVLREPGFYYDLLAGVARNVVLWKTAYVHEMESHASIVEMMKSTALRPYVRRIDAESERDRFLHEVTDEVRASYPAQRNGRVLFPFHRLFFIAYR